MSLPEGLPESFPGENELLMNMAHGVAKDNEVITLTRGQLKQMVHEIVNRRLEEQRRTLLKLLEEQMVQIFG